jgi:hypothetical protein
MSDALARLDAIETELAVLRAQIKARRVWAKDAIKVLDEARAAVPPGSPETLYQTALEEKLTDIGLAFEHLHLPDLGGHGDPDIFVPMTEPPLLIEV